MNNLVLKKSGDAQKREQMLTLADHSQLNTKYYWYIKSTIGGVDSNGPLWSFTTETGKAIDPSPADGEEDVDVNDVNLSWTTPTAATYAVYLSTDRSLVEANNLCVRIADGISVSSG